MKINKDDFVYLVDKNDYATILAYDKDKFKLTVKLHKTGELVDVNSYDAMVYFEDMTSWEMLEAHGYKFSEEESYNDKIIIFNHKYTSNYIAYENNGKEWLFNIQGKYTTMTEGLMQAGLNYLKELNRGEN